MAGNQAGGKTMFPYRQDIDGLRAVAVVLVTLFHINEGLLPGGFIGVDIFFVISGYLITGMILRDRAAGTFSFAEFYRRRVRRILPAMFVVTSATVVLGSALMLPDDVTALSWSAVATVFSAANIYFTYYLDTSYFAADSSTVPLLHMWSLGVEEQFYLVWPAALLLILRWPRAVFPAVLLIAAMSTAFGEWQLSTGQFSWAYYMLPARAFELCAGALLAIAERSGKGVCPPGFTFPLSLTGAGLVFLSVFLLSGEDAYPGLKAVPVTLGTVMLLASGAARHPVSALLSLKPVRWIGLISYSLYLWHWPVLAVQRYFYPELSIASQIGSALIMIVLAQLTYSFVEQPFRRCGSGFGGMLVRLWIAPACLVVCLAFINIQTSGLGPWMYTDYAQQVKRPVRGAYSYPFVCQAPRITQSMIDNEDCVLGGQKEPAVLLYGDSHASHYVGALRALTEQLHFSFRNISHSACPPIGGDPTPFVADRRLETCKASLEAMRSVLPKYETIVLAANWSSYEDSGNRSGTDFRPELDAVVTKLRRAGKKIVLIGVVPFQPDFERNCIAKKIKYPLLDCTGISADDEQPSINEYLKELARVDDGIWYLDPYPALCQDGSCRAFDGEQPLYFDPSHLSMAGSERVGTAWSLGVGADLHSLTAAFQREGTGLLPASLK